MERFKQITSIYLILIKSGKVLLLRRVNTGYEDGKYGLPSGHLEDNETIREGIKREAKEEITKIQHRVLFGFEHKEITSIPLSPIS